MVDFASIQTSSFLSTLGPMDSPQKYSVAAFAVLSSSLSKTQQKSAAED
jgi:hypothetical protein